MKTVKITQTHAVEVPRLINGRPSYVWVNGYTYPTKTGGQACADTLKNTLRTCAQEWPDTRIVVEG
jgi:hypothetical protein